MGEVYVYEPNADDLDCMGMCGALTPTSCVHTEEANGMSEIELQHPIDENGRWSFLLDGYILKAEVPVRTTPEIQDGALVTTVEKWTVKPTASKASRYLYTKKSGGKKKKLLPKNLTLTVVLKGETRHKVKTKRFGTGWISINAIQYVLTETIPNDPAAIEQVEPAWSVRSQLFRIYDHEVTDTGVTAYARHISYDLLGNCTTYDGSSAKFAYNPTCVEAGEGILNGCVCPHDFEFYTNMLDTRAGVRWIRQNPINALLDPEEGLCVQWGAEIVRDDWDIIVLREAGLNRGVRIEYAKNLLGVQCEIDSTDIITRIIPVGQTAKGGALMLSGAAPWVDSLKITDYPVPHVFVLDLGSKVKAKSTKSADVTAARTKLRQKAQEKFDSEECDVPALSLKVDFLNLGDTEEYRDYAQMETLFLYDRVRVYHPDLMIDALCEVRRMEWNCLTGRSEKIELGSVRFLSKARPIAKWQIPSGINGESKLARDSVSDANLAEFSVTAKSLAEEAVEEYAILNGAVTPPKLSAGFFEADEIQAALATIVVANITTANIQNANIDWASIATLTAQMATIAVANLTTANIAQANIDWAAIATLNVQIATVATAQITAANIERANIQWAEIESLAASIATIAKAQITTANIKNASIDWADIATLQANIAEIAAAQITTANIRAANIDWANILTLNSVIANIAKAQITTANIAAASIDWASITSLNTAIASIARAQITTANIQNANINWAYIASLQTNIADIVVAKIGAADIDFARIKDLAVGTAIITQGVGGELYINKLCVTDANMVSLTTGELLLKDSQGNFRRLYFDEVTGEVKSEIVKVAGSNVASNTISGGNLIQNTITARELSVASIFADSALIGAIKAANIDVANLLASSAFIGKITTAHLASDVGTALNITSNTAILAKADKTVVDALGSRMTTAESKITPDAITSTVRGSTQYTADLAAKLGVTAYNTDKIALQAADVAVSATAPTSPPTGKLWVDTSGTAPQLKRWTGTAWQIVTDLSKAEKAALDALAARVTTAETSITQTQDSIALKADKTVTDGLNTRLTSAEQKITPEAITTTVRGSSQYIADLAAKLATSTYNTDKNALQNADVAVSATAPASPPTGKLWVDTAGTLPQLKRWTGTAWQIVTDLSKADASALTALTTRVSTAETNITQTQTSINLKADKTVTDGLNTRLTSAEQKITPDAITSTVRGHSTYIADLAAKLATSTYNTDKTALQNADVAVSVTAPASPPTGKLWVDISGVPQLKRWTCSAWQVVTDLSKADAAALAALTTRVSTAETNITQTQTSIALKADKTVTDGLNTRLTSAESKITPDAITSTVRSHAQYIADKTALQNADVSVGATAPASPPAGKLWVDSSSTPPQLKRWTGSAWQIVTDLSKADKTAVDDLIGRMSGAETRITQSAQAIEMKANRLDVERYMRFDANALTLGLSDNPFTCKITNSRISFMRYTEEIAYISESKLYITSGEIRNELRVGNYVLTSTADGGMAIKLG